MSNSKLEALNEAFRNAYCQCGTDPDITRAIDGLQRRVQEYVAAALAACARETLQQAEKACEALYAQPISCAEVGMCIEAIRALERAAGESK